MKKFIKTIITLIIFILLTTMPAYAITDERDKEFMDQQYDVIDSAGLTRELPEETRELLESLGIENIEFNEVYNLSFTKVFSLLKSLVTGELNSPIKFMAIMVGVIILLSVADALLPQSSHEAARLVCSLFFIISVVGAVISYSSYLVSAIQTSCNFMLGFIPVFTAVVSVSGNPASAISYNTLAMAIAQGASAFTSTFLLPLTSMFIVLSIASSVSPNLNIDGMAQMLKKTVIVVLTALSTVFTGFLSLKGILASSVDTVALKSGKFLINSAIPIIGSSLSEGLSSIVGSMSMLKNAVGVFGIIAVVIINVPALIQALLWMCSISLTAFAAEAMGQKDAAKLLRNLNAANVILITVMIFVMILIIISIALILVFKASL
ncbi:MAG: stage III sporulation protein AE [Oscillospiraceae bacterium]|jgi:stage III sporulation protein AE|nr:stage III sporulation protein AE [Oscillospiraceae bacterium]